MVYGVSQYPLIEGIKNPWTKVIVHPSSHPNMKFHHKLQLHKTTISRHTTQSIVQILAINSFLILFYPDDCNQLPNTSVVICQIPPNFY